ncbi:uncharacterized protein LOC127932290 isoform X24 [Oncorhynchus keta]|uniref:uncharacterized protein LOC127932290 isoform X24 n=1 Tax=Oncorhynchus keta TaxID=8018 RepID=UPI00227BCA74|nr:uncharacterized protein LOC127932290 isoform X24 [Oncorhynchus keta]
MLKRQFRTLKAQGRLPLDLPLRPMKAWLLAGKRVFLERETETWKRWRKVCVAELTWDAKRGLELQETERVLLVSCQRVQDELRMSDFTVDTAPNKAIQLLKEECWKLNFLHLKDETCQATELTELYGHSETSSKETLIEEKSPKTKYPSSVTGAADIDNTNEEASEESPNNSVVDFQDESLALVSVEKDAAGDGKVKVVKPKGCLKESCKDQLTPTIYDMITELPKSYFGSTESLPEMCIRGPNVCSGVPDVSNAVGEVSSDTMTTEAAEDLLDTGNVLRKVVQLSTESHAEVCNGETELCSGGPEVCRGGPEVCSRGPEVCSGGPEVCSGGPEVCSGGPEVCSGGPEVSNEVEEVCSDTMNIEATGNLLKTGNGLSKVVLLSTESRPDVCIRVPEVYSGCPEVFSEVFSEVPEAPNAVEEVSSDTKTEAAEELRDTENVLSKVVKSKGWLKEGWEDQLTKDFNDMIARLPKSYFGSTESLPEMCSRGPEVCSGGPEVCSGGPEVCSGGPEVCSGGPEVSNEVEEVCSDTMNIEATGNLLKTGNGLSKVVLLSTESRPDVCIRVPEVYSEVFSEVPEAPNAVEEVSSDTKTEAAEELRDTENVLSKVVKSKGWLKEGWEDQLTKDFNDMIARLPKSYFGSNESLPEVCSGVPEVSNAAEVVRSDTKKQKKNGVLRFFRRVWKFFTCTNSLPKEE